MSTTIEHVTVTDQPPSLGFSSRLGYGTIMPVAVGCMVVCVVWAVAAIFTLPDEWIGPVAALPAAIAAIVLALASILDRTRLTVTSAGITWGTRPIPLPRFPSHGSLRTGQIASIFVSPCPIANRFGLIHSFEILALSTDGRTDRLLARIRSLPKAKDMAALIESRLGIVRPQTPPPLSTVSRPVCSDDSPIPGGAPFALFCVGVFIAGLLIFAAPFLRTMGKVEASSTITYVEKVSVSGSKHSYIRRVCVVEYRTPSGLYTVRVSSEGCPASAQEGDRLPIYYDPKNPEDFTVRAFWKWPFGLIYCLLGASGLIYTLMRRRKDPSKQMLAEDSFRSLDPFWDFRQIKAKASKGLLTIDSEPGRSVLPVLCRKAFRSPSIELQVRARAGNSAIQAAGILFWADGLDHGYAFTVLPFSGGVEVLRIWNNRLDRVLPLVRLPQVAAAVSDGGWTTLQVVTRGTKADLFVNGASAGTITGVLPPGGSLAGVFAGFPKDSTASWEFAGFRVWDQTPV